MSKLPISNTTRTNQGSPPIKNRKALNNITQVINSPTFSKHSTLNKDLANRRSLKIESKNQRIPQTSIPTGSFISEAMQTARKYSLAASKLESKRTEKSNRQSNIFDSSSLTDPAALKKQQQMEERFEKYVGVQRQKLEELNRQIRESKEKVEELTRLKNGLTRNAIDLKSKIDDSEVNVINMDHKIEMLEKSVEKTINHEEQMNTIRLKEQQNILIRELDEFEGMLNQELQNAVDYKDDESVNEIAKLNEESNHLSHMLSSLNQATKERLNKEVDHLEKELTKIVAAEEAKGDELAKIFESKSTDLEGFKAKVDAVKSEVRKVKDEREELSGRIRNQLEFQSSYDDKLTEVQRRIQDLTIQNSDIDDELRKVTQECETVTTQYNESLHKIDKEKKLRRRIENTIQELNGKLRVYTRILNHDSDEKIPFKINQQDDDQRQNLTIGETYHTFDKVFDAGLSDPEISDEIVCLSENNLNGANVSIVVTGFEETTLIHDLLKATMKNLIQREEKYKPKHWCFNYTIQYLSITTEGVVDLLSGDKSSIKLENRSIQTDAQTISSIEEIKDIEVPNDASTLIKITVSGSNLQKSIIASTYLMNLSQIKSSDLILHAVTKIRENKFSSTEFSQSPMYQLIHFLYSNTKALTLVNLSNSADNVRENEKLLELATFVHQTDSISVKRVYNAPPSK